MQLSGAQMVCEGLLREGVEVMFGLPGGAILPFYQTLPSYPQLRHILVRHEQNAGHAADGYARASGKVGVAIATSGPGATNLVTPLATAMMDSVPLVAITGQVPRAAIGRDAFQETDITGITMPVTKHNYLVMRTADVPRVLKEAFHIARTGRPGPVLVDLPRDVLSEVAEFDYPDQVNLSSYRPTLDGHSQMVRRAAQLIREARRPLILAGHGVLISGAVAELRELAEKAQIPVITTLLGIGGFNGRHVLSLGMPGMHGQAHNNWAIDRADLVIGVGMRFDDRVTGRISAFAPGAKIIHIDIDPAEVGKNVGVTVPIVGDAKRVLHALANEVEPAVRSEWLKEIDELRERYPSRVQMDSDKLLPQFVVRELCEATGGSAVIVTGVGQHQMWAAQHYTFAEPYTWITSGGLGTMGFEVPAALGAAFAQPGKTVWSIAGDGGFQMTMSELATDPRAQRAGEIRDSQQQLARVGAPAPGPVLRRRPRGQRLHRQSRLREDRRGVRHLGRAGHGEHRGPRRHRGRHGGLRARVDRLSRRAQRERLPSPAGRRERERDDRGPNGRGRAGMAEVNTHTITALVQDRPGVLARIAGMFSRRGFNISNLAVGHSETAGLSRMTFVVEGDQWVVEQVTKQLYKLIDVVRVNDISSDSIVVRELALIKVKSSTATRHEIMQIVDIFRANIIDVATDALIIEVTGGEEKVDALLQLLRPFGIKETMRTGRVAMSRGAAATGARRDLAPATHHSAPDTAVVP